MEPLNEALARKTVKRYACSICWGELELRPAIHLDNGWYFVVCKKCQDETRGYVTQFFVNRRRGESEFEKVNVTHLMQKLGLIENPLKGKNQKELIKELGF